MYILKIVFLPLIVYLIASIPFGLVLTRLFTSADIRSAGSGNIGATNVLRSAGRFWGILTLICDLLKGAAPVWLAAGLAGCTNGIWPQGYVSLVAVCAFSGHLFPVYTKFKGGGKGVATAAGCFFAISPPAGIVALLVFILFFCMTGRVSAGSLAGAAVLPLAVWKSSHSLLFAGCAVAVAIAIHIRHRENIVRLLTGKEPPMF